MNNRNYQGMTKEKYNNFVKELEAERDWRIAEFGRVKRILQIIQKTENEKYVRTYLKMTIPMIYAHWEGYCVASFKLMAEYINKEEIDARMCTYNLITYANTVAYDKLKGKSSFEHRTEFSREFEKILDGKLKIPARIDTKSNLNYKVLKEILDIFEININKFQKYESDLNTLVNIRNAIAHGENSIIPDIEKMEKSIKCITEMIDIFLVEQTEYIKNEDYLKS